MARRFLASAGVVLLAVAGPPALADAKHHRPGTLDPSFGPKGATFHAGGISGSLLPDGLDNFGGLAFDSSGRIILAGDTDTPAGNDFVLGRLGHNGRIDQTFGNPATHLSVGDVDVGSDDEAKAIAAGPNGTIYVATDTSSGGVHRFGISRVAAGGSFDGGFDVDGRTTTTIGPDAVPGAIAVQRNGRPVIAGQASIAGKQNLALVRYLPNGTPDPSFGGGDGIATTSIGQGFIAFDAKVQKDGKIVVAGGVQVGGSGARAAAVRYRANGTLDPSFGSGGIVRMKVSKFSVAFGIALGSRGKVVLVGVSDAKVSGYVARLTRRGKRDHSFGGGDGLLRSNLRQGFAYVTDVALQRNGKIVLAGFGGDVFGVPGGTLVARLTPKGRLDRRFGIRGARLFLLGATAFSLPEVAIQKSGRIVVGGAFSAFGTDGFLAARLYG